MLENHSDFELVTLYKDKQYCKRCLELLYIRYLPLIKKFAVKVCFWGKDRERKKDYEQDAYFKVIECIDQINIKKIPYQIHTTWKFSSRFKYYLLNLSKSYYYQFKSSYCMDLESIVELPSNHNFEEQSCIRITHDHVMNFLDTTPHLQEFEKDLFKRRLQGYSFVQLHYDTKISGTDYYVGKVINFLKQNLTIQYEVE